VKPGAEQAEKGWLRRNLRLEDALLFGALAFVEPLLFPPQPGSADGGPDLIVGLLDLVGLLAFVACLAARSASGVVSGLFGKDDVLYAVGPLFGAFAFTVEDTGEKLGLEGDFVLIPVAAAIAVAVLVRRLVPPLTSIQRRVLVTPFILVTSRFFGEFLSGFTEFLDLRQLAAAVARPDELPVTALLIGVGIVGILIFYVMLVYAPRQVANREGTAATWAVRFLLFLVSLAIGQTLTGLIHPA
jgi:hypothetical protein